MVLNMFLSEWIKSKVLIPFFLEASVILFSAFIRCSHLTSIYCTAKELLPKEVYGSSLYTGVLNFLWQSSLCRLKSFHTQPCRPGPLIIPLLWTLLSAFFLPSKLLSFCCCQLMNGNLTTISRRIECLATEGHILIPTLPLVLTNGKWLC